MCQWCNDFQCLAGLARLLFRGQEAHRAHVVQPVSHLDYQHPWVAGRAPSRDTYLAKVRTEIVNTLNASKIKATVEGRPKHYWSIYQKMIVKGRDFDDIHDLVGIRILCDEIRDCYAAVGVVHSLWQPMAGRF